MNFLMSLLVFWILSVLWTHTKAGPVPLTVNGHLLSTGSLDQQNHQIIFHRIGEYATDVEFHHVHIPVQLGMQIQIADQAMKIINKYADNISQETLMHYKEHHRYCETGRSICNTANSLISICDHQLSPNFESNQRGDIVSDRSTSTITSEPQNGQSIRVHIWA